MTKTRKNWSKRITEWLAAGPTDRLLPDLRGYPVGPVERRTSRRT
jgi:hypothetical protein